MEDEEGVVTQEKKLEINGILANLKYNENNKEMVYSSIKRLRKILCLETENLPATISYIFVIGLIPFLIDLLKKYSKKSVDRDEKEVEVILSFDYYKKENQYHDLTYKDYIIVLETKILYEIVWSMANIASGSTDECLYLARRGVIPPLVSLLKKSNVGIIENCLWAICNLAGDNGLSRKNILDTDALETIVEIFYKINSLENIEDKSLLKHICWAFQQMFSILDISMERIILLLPVFDKTLDLLMQVMENLDVEEAIINICRPLVNLASSFNPQIFSYIRSFNFVDKMIQLLYHKTNDCLINNLALIFIGHIFQQYQEDDILRILNRNKGFLKYILKNVNLLSKNNESLNDLVWIIGNIVLNAPSIQLLIDSGIVKKLCNISTEHFERRISLKPRDDRDIIFTICKIILNSSPDQVLYMVDLGCIHYFSNYLFEMKNLHNRTIGIMLDCLVVFLERGKSFMDINEDNNGDGNDNNNNKDHNPMAQFFKNENLLSRMIKFKEIYLFTPEVDLIINSLINQIKN
ncbi:hypothetical protein DICPUDRAFT_146500 [Dictyostelium purpureum]|uniref:Importin subunit alpha n=1 Tax=Dictyostelium purpureum TaxID=5786 RepID=F0Z647_DICPU|nr:uncharacterized protein DICPUDRAFT_146500 [Dictyostelium purpureum]EGC40538.1 hypothetical protein DICPUDRAFT_146500 [Dictyostelium purpureum]|eukprot:XP_003282874.1 hypothetical protein DICPUDRAFT_146500 [Dictyostelium purpureum]